MPMYEFFNLGRKCFDKNRYQCIRRWRCLCPCHCKENNKNCICFSDEYFRECSIDLELIADRYFRIEHLMFRIFLFIEKMYFERMQ